MLGNVARLVLLATCVILAVLLLTRVLTILISCLIFALALMACGTLLARWRRT